jgi:hypothetical protein
LLRRLLSLPLLWLLLAAGLAPAGARQPAGQRPNFLLVLAGDIGFSHLGCYGSEMVIPALDRLAADRTELHNLAGQQPDTVKEMAALYRAWEDRCGVLPWARGGPVVPRPVPPDAWQ